MTKVFTDSLNFCNSIPFYNKSTYCSCCKVLTIAWLPQVVERWSAMWEVEGSSLDQTNTWDPQTSEENVLPLLWRLQVVDILVLMKAVGSISCFLFVLVGRGLVKEPMQFLQIREHIFWSSLVSKIFTIGGIYKIPFQKL